VLSFADVEDMYNITYRPQESFTVHLPERDIIFYRRDKLYVADFSRPVVAVTKAYTKAEEARAQAAYEIICNCGYPSITEAIHLIQDGNLTHMPMLTAEDVRRAYDLYGEPVGSVRGKLTKKKISRSIYDNNLLMDQKKQVLHTDVMHVDGQHFLVTVCEPLQLVLQCPVERETALVLGTALQNQIELLRSRGFVPIRVQTDPQSAFRTLTTKFENVVIDTGGAGDYVPKADIQKRRIKEIVRGIKAVLPWKLPPFLLKDLVAFAVSRINIKRSTAVNQNVCARVAFTGIKPDFRKELSLGFGDYCEVFDGTDNTTRSRSLPCVTLYPCCNLTGSWVFYSFTTKTRIRRTQWKKMITLRSLVKI
jgi:hypothetical protein